METMSQSSHNFPGLPSLPRDSQPSRDSLFPGIPQLPGIPNLPRDPQPSQRFPIFQGFTLPSDPTTSQGSPTFLRFHSSHGSPVFPGILHLPVIPQLPSICPTSCVTLGRAGIPCTGMEQPELLWVCSQFPPTPRSSHIPHYSRKPLGLGFVSSGHPQPLLSRGSLDVRSAPRESPAPPTPPYPGRNLDQTPTAHIFPRQRFID